MHYLIRAAAVAGLMCCFSCTPLVNTLSFFPDRDNMVNDADLPEGVSHFFIRGEKRIRLESYYLVTPGAENVLIYFHGNGGNIGQRLPDLIRLRSMGVNVLGFSYRGYGKSSGHPSEKGIYRDGETVYRFVRDSLGFPERNVFLIGRSIGSTAAVATAQNKNLSGVILVTPLSSGKDYARAHGVGWLSFISGDCFNNVEKGKNILSPVLVIHGTGDEVVPYWCGRKLYSVISSEKGFLTIKNGLHNSLERKDPERYWGSIYRFLSTGVLPVEDGSGK